MRSKSRIAHLSVAAFAAAYPLTAWCQTTQDIRVVTYNTQGDVDPPTPSQVIPQLATVLEGVGQEKYVADGILQLPDVIALQETTSNSVTVEPLVNDLNSYYGSDIYNYSTYQATTSDGDTDGGGPNALIYNQNTLNLVNSYGVGTPEGTTNGEFRQVVLYEFQPLDDKGTNNGVFYVYDSHYKSGDASTKDEGITDGTLRNEEAQIIRNNEAAFLPSNASVLYVGDYNGDGSNEAAYQTITAANSPSGVNQGQGVDPLNPTDNYNESWAENSQYEGIMTESDDDLRYRDDMQIMTDNVYGDAPGVLDYVANSEHAFGNNGGTAVYGNVDSNSNTAVNDIIGNGPLTPSEVLGAMNSTTGSDHLAVVADYSMTIGPFTLSWNNSGGTGNGTTWDTTNQNWNTGYVPIAYADNDSIIFNDVNNGNYDVTLNGIVNPASVLIDNSNGNYTISGSGSIAGSGSLTKSGSATAILSTVNTYTGGTTVNGGLLIIGASGALPANQALTLSGGNLQLAQNTGGASISSLSISNGSALDITNNHVIISDPGGSIDSTIEGYLAAGYNGGGWNGTSPGGSIITSASTGTTYGIGWADGAAGGISGISSGQLEIKYTLYGDTNLDGTVNSVDFGTLAANFGTSGPNIGWAQGAFTYNNTVNSVDFGLLAANFGNSLGSAGDVVTAADWAALYAFAEANGLMSEVPEPTSLALMSLATVGILARRARKKIV